jgi:hypothetical protein
MDLSLLNNLANQLETIANDSRIKIESKLNDENLSKEERAKLKEVGKLQADLLIALQNKDVIKLNELVTHANNLNK